MKKTILLILIVLLLFSCAKKKDAIATKTTETISNNEVSENDINSDFETKNLTPEEIDKIVKQFGELDNNIPHREIKKPVYTISKDYLKDQLVFKTLDYSLYKNKQISVVGTTGVMMYADMEGKKTVCDLPKGAIVEITEEIVNKNQNNKDLADYFVFNNEYNYWYKAKYNGKSGYIFGSYLVNEESINNIVINNYWMFNEKLESNVESQKNRYGSLNNRLQRVAFLYNQNKKSPDFYDINGISKLSEPVKNLLIINKIALEKVSYDEYKRFLNTTYENYDDMIVLYKMLQSDKTAGTFISIDFLMHNLHLLFDKMLENTEETVFLPILSELTKSYLQKIEELEKNIKDENASYKETIEGLKKYFLVASYLLKVNSYTLDRMSEDVKQEINYIQKAEGFVEKTPIFQYKEDYSQFTPRGHYTKSEELKAYFKAMIWFGRLHFYAVSDSPSKEDNENSIRLTKMALLLTKIAKENNNIFGMWKAVYAPITYLIGESDDYTLIQYLMLSGGIDFNNFDEWIKKDENIIGFIKKAEKELKAPKISGNTLNQHKDQNENTGKIPQGFRFYGQRFTFDSFIHNLLSSPRVGDSNNLRTMVKGADVMAVLGNNYANELINEDRSKYKNFNENFSYLQNKVNDFSTDDFLSTFYNSYLKTIKEITSFDKDKRFYFTQSPAWTKKSLNTSLATWAELRHDTILYVKQNYAELAGKGPEKTWKIDELEKPISYVEPNLGALYWLDSILTNSIEILSNKGIMTTRFKVKYEAYSKNIKQLIEIAELEATDKPISKEQNEFLSKLPYDMNGIIAPISNNLSHTLEEKDLQMALIADVHTDSDKGLALEVGTGIPYRIYIALNDDQGGKRIVEGYVFSYFEFTTPISNRMNDDQWKEKVYGKDKKYIEERRPNWILDLIAK